MQLYPAIDMKDGKCVRLKQGEFKEVTVYCDEPYLVARYFEEKGASFIHLVDLDGALMGHSVNEEAIKKVVSSVRIPCELGGGIRTMEDIERVLSYGVSRVIIGTKAVKNPEFVKEAIERFGADRIVVGVDAKNGIELLDEIISKLANGEALAEKHRDHNLTGNWSGFRECHILPDWLLIYRVENDVLVLTLTRTGTHSDLFGK